MFTLVLDGSGGYYSLYIRDKCKSINAGILIPFDKERYEKIKRMCDLEDLAEDTYMIIGIREKKEVGL